MESPQFVVVTNGRALTAPNFTVACLECDRQYQTFGVNRSRWPVGQPNPHYVGYVIVVQGSDVVARIDHTDACWLVEAYDIWNMYYANKERVPYELEQAVLEHFWNTFASDQVTPGFAHMVTAPCYQN